MPTPSSPFDPRVEQLFLEYLARRDGGEEPDVTALCDANPQQAVQFRELLAAYDAASRLRPREGSAPLAERLKRQFGDGVDPGVSLGGEPASDAGPQSKLFERLRAEGPRGTRYRLLGEVARGGMGAILRVWDEELRRTLAMKVVLGRGEVATGDTPAVDPKTLGRFLEEAQITGQLDHPGIVPVHELGLDATGRVYFTMKLVKGRDLKHVFELVHEGKEDWNQTRALGVLLRVCEAMAYAHDKGVVHRDLKPANVMVGRYGEVYVMDWGLARVLGREDRHDVRVRPPSAQPPSVVKTERAELGNTPDSPIVTMDGDVVGTPCYMPPEQARGELEKLGPHSDVYSIGAMLYQLLSGQMPYVPKGARVSPHAVLARVVEGPPRQLKELAPHAPPELVAVCEAAMARDIGSRYTNTLALADDLRAYLERRVVSAYRMGASAEFVKWTERHPSAFAAILFVAAGVVGPSLLALWYRVADLEPYSPYAYLCLLPWALTSAGACILVSGRILARDPEPVRQASAACVVVASGAVISSTLGKTVPEYEPWLSIAGYLLIHPVIIARMLHTGLGRGLMIYTLSAIITTLFAVAVIWTIWGNVLWIMQSR